MLKSYFFYSKNPAVSFSILNNGKSIYPVLIQMIFSILFLLVGLQANSVPVCVVQIEKPG